MENWSARSTTTRFSTSSAKPKQSNPGPRLLIVPGTLIVTRWTGVKKDSVMDDIREVRAFVWVL
eukprot:2196904-Prymnesium_polylepis.1